MPAAQVRPIQFRMIAMLPAPGTEFGPIFVEVAFNLIEILDCS